MAEGNGTASHQQQRLIRVSEGQRALVLAFMSEHPQLAAKAIELQHGVTVADRRRLWQELSDALNLEGPAQKSADDWQACWRRQVHEARRDAAAIKEAQTGTGGGRLPGFRGRVLQLTGLARFGGVFGSLEYQQVSTLPPQYHGFLSGAMTEFAHFVRGAFRGTLLNSKIVQEKEFKSR
ncbi:uncharacterized protein LOC142785238 isoform X1 [Rhipicephalus microplus]|uniref:uncharacterized protein LOC142785238 isoform X1 n=1 Tax=Rhipicephalus microplus TaxID=6941 RepID=UPI003F6B1FC5